MALRFRWIKVGLRACAQRSNQRLLLPRAVSLYLSRYSYGRWFPWQCWKPSTHTHTRTLTCTHFLLVNSSWFLSWLCEEEEKCLICGHDDIQEVQRMNWAAGMAPINSFKHSNIGSSHHVSCERFNHYTTLQPLWINCSGFAAHKTDSQVIISNKCKCDVNAWKAVAKRPS